MNQVRMPNQDSATGRGLKTTLQALIGAAVGLFLAIWAVPGVPETVIKYAQANFLPILLSVGIPSGVASFIWNAYLRKDVPNY